MPELLHDGPLWISKGKSRLETNWKNTQTTWGKLVAHLQKTQTTRESHKEYLSYSKDDQDRIKDVGGFVGGIINGGRRKKYNVGMRQLVTLDLDTATLDFFSDLQLMYEEALCVYSTHKHSLVTPRYRLIMPLNREVHADEYEAIARMLADLMGMDLFDHTTFQPERLMYWPSTPRDIEYFYRYQDGPWLDADAILARYRDWKDLSQWPRHALEKDKIARGINMAGDPLDKPGVIGAFCQVYSITDAIARFLPQEYAPCDVPDRYTYTGGSTAAGLVVYEDKWAYSHHSTDPCSEKLCNAFDLVRLHTFGGLDEGVKSDVPVNKRPSYLAMIDMAVNDEPVKLRVSAMLIEGATFDFSAVLKPEEAFSDSLEDEPGDGREGAGEEAPPVDLGALGLTGGVEDEPDMGEVLEGLPAADAEWLAKMELDRKGHPYNTIDNVLVVLRNDRWLKGKFHYNAFTNRQIITGNVPWRRVKKSSNLFTDTDDAGLRCYLESVYKLNVASKIQDALVITFLDNSFHPIRDFLKTLLWDGEPRLDRLLIDYMGAEDSEYTRVVTRKTVVAAVTRVFRPGIKYETVLTLIGRQGFGKSTLIRKIGGQWFSDSMRTFHGKEAIEQLQGAWIIELGELAALKKADVETIKTFVSVQVDRMRAAYGRRVDDFPRQCIFIASTNEDLPLKDASGGRRFWPIKCGVVQPVKSVFRDLDDYEREQVLAEAVELFRKGETVYLDTHMEHEARKVQNSFREIDDRAGEIWQFLDTPVPEDWYSRDIQSRVNYFRNADDLVGEKVKTMLRDRICAAEIWAELFEGFERDMTPNNTRFIHDIMRNTVGWAQYEGVKERYTFYGIHRSYRRIK